MSETLQIPQRTGVWRWTRREYWTLARRGFFDGARVELLEGVIVAMSPQYDPHAASLTLTHDALRAAFGPAYWVRIGATLNLGKFSQPDPDLSVVSGSPKGRTTAGIPKGALLVVEISHTTLRKDRGVKAGIYAAAGIADYWIVNVRARQLEVRRDPQPDPMSRSGYGYSSLATYKPGATVSPLAAPNAAVAVDDLLP